MLLALVFAPAVFGLIPGHLRWMHALPIEGLTGRLVVDTLVHYLNFPGAAIVIVSMVVIALYLSTTFSFNTAQQWMAIRFAFVLAWRDRVRNWRSAWARTRAEKNAAKRDALQETEHCDSRRKRRRKKPQASKSRRAAFEDVSSTESAPMPGPHTPTLWNQMPRTSIPDQEAEAFDSELEPDLPLEADAIATAIPSQGAAGSRFSGGEHEGRKQFPSKAAPMPRSGPSPSRPATVSGFRLPPSTLLHRSDETQIVREDDLREQATDPGRKMRGVRCTRPGGADQSRPGGHHLRIPS